MLITRETDYALRILRELSDGERHNMKELCQEENIPQQFAYKILRKLADAGLVKSVRGVNGGVRMIRDPEELTILDVMKATEAEEYISDCMKPGAHCPWAAKHCGHCSVHTRLRQIQDVMETEMKKSSLKELFNE